MLDNKYIQPRFQKGFLEGVVEHTSVHSKMLANAKRHERSIAIAWLDLENAYGSVRHMLVQFALKWYHVPTPISELLFRYYDSIFLTVVTDDWRSDYFHLGIGVPQGCTASTIVFDVAFQVVLDIHASRLANKSIGYHIKEAQLTVVSPTYADDVALVARTAKWLQLSVVAFQGALKWTVNLRLKPPKCRTLAFRKFRQEEKKMNFQKVQDSDYSCYDPLIVIDDQKLKFVGDGNPPMQVPWHAI